jgi:dGTP triphosphohydrolase
MDKQFEHMQKLAFGKKSINELTTKSAFKRQIKEMILAEINEAKKKKSEDVAPQEDVELNIDTPVEPSTEASTDTMAPEMGSAADINPTVKSIQDSLQKAFASAKELGDAKLVTQIGNTITMLVRDQVLGGGQQAVAEGMEDINDEIYNDIDLAVSNEAYNRFIDAASAISDDLISKGFEAKDIYDYLNARILAEA